MNLSFFNNRKILVTGCTGFKGSWLTEMLLDAGAKVCGYALEPPTIPALFDILGLRERLGEDYIQGDVRDLGHLQAVFTAFQPEFVLHLAAQPIVRESYKSPVYTYETNVMGTVNVLECVRHTPSVISVLNVTTDKVYENPDTDRAYEEGDPLDGYDPYSNSKSCSELVTHSYVKSFFNDLDLPVSTARAGNVIGGGDYAVDRLIPDCVRAAQKKEAIQVRNPNATRPFQHVLEPLTAYLLLLEAQVLDHTLAGAYNVGPDEGSILSVSHMADLFVSSWGEGSSWFTENDGGPHEAAFLRLNNEKLKSTLPWHPVWDAKTAVEKTVEFEKAADKKACIQAQIAEFLDKLV